MLDVKMVRAHPDLVRRSLQRRGAATSPLDEFLAVEEGRRALTTEVESMRAERKRASEAIGARKKAGEDASAEMAATRELGERIKALEVDLAAAEARLHDLLLNIPNLVADDVPDGGEDDAVVLREVGERPSFAFEPRDHLDLGVAHDWIDMERAARASGSRFAYLKGDLVLLELALLQYALGIVTARGYRPVLPPVLVREEAMFGTGFFPADEQQIYRTTDGDCLVGTAEVPLAALHMDEFLEAEALPLRYAGYSACFRREAGAAGKDTRGILRVHQFDKLEMFSFCLPEQAEGEHELIRATEEEIFGGLGVPYRVVNIAAGDLGAPAAKKYDLEAWMPGQQRYREITSCSNCTDYQARRLNCRYRTDKGPRFVYTLNGTAVAMSRALIAIIENCQRADGTVAVPPALVPFLGRETIGS